MNGMPKPRTESTQKAQAGEAQNVEKKDFNPETLFRTRRFEMERDFHVGNADHPDVIENKLNNIKARLRMFSYELKTEYTTDQLEKFAQHALEQTKKALAEGGNTVSGDYKAADAIASTIIKELERRKYVEANEGKEPDATTLEDLAYLARKERRYE